MIESFGAKVTQQGIDFTVWAPVVASIDVIVHGARAREIRMRAGEGGIHRAHVDDAGAGTRYQFQIDGKRFPDPNTRYQPEGPHGPSMAIDPHSHVWTDAAWRGITLQGQVIYEVHIGTFTEAGTFDAAIERLEWLRSIGVTVIEIMPIAEFPGRFNWGYDGVNLFAPFHGYGDYDSFKRFVDAAHRVGLAIILDVVYNHLGPSGNYLHIFSPHYFSTHLSNDWGTPFNVDGEQSARVRDYLLDNASYWIREFHLDGLRLDATTNIPDTSESHIIAEIVECAHEAAGARSIIVIAEDEQQQASRMLPRERGGFGIDAMWNDDFHHTAQVALRGHRHAYLNDYTGSAQEFISAAKRGFLFQGQYYFWQRQPRGERLRTPARSCIHFLDNHDQVANSLRGQRSQQCTSSAKFRALTAILLLGPQTPMLFMGQEFGAETPFLYFADHDGDLRDAVIRGRKVFLEQFASIATPEGLKQIADPADESTFHRSKLRWRPELQDCAAVSMHRDLLALRRDDPVLKEQDATALDGAVLSPTAFVLRWFNDVHGDRLLIVNLGVELQFQPGPEPLLAPAPRCYWSPLWSSERIAYGGGGVEIPDAEAGWRIPGETATLLCERSHLSARDCTLTSKQPS